MQMILMDATTPNSFMIAEWVNIKVPNPIEVVALVKKVAFPTLDYSIKGFNFLTMTFKFLLKFIDEVDTVWYTYYN